MRRALASVVLVSFLTGVSGAVGAGATKAGVAGYGVFVQVSVNRTTYPADALIPVQVRVANNTHRFVSICGFCSSPPVSAEVVNRAGDVLYPVELPDMPAPLGPGPSVRRNIGVQAGKSMVTRQYLILRSNRLRAVVRLGQRGKRGRLETPLLHFKLGTEAAPSLRLALQPQISIRVQSAPSDTGSLLYTFSYKCQGGITGGSDWVTAPNPVITPDIAPECGDLLALHLIAGWLNHAVGSLDYVKS